MEKRIGERVFFSHAEAPPKRDVQGTRGETPTTPQQAARLVAASPDGGQVSQPEEKTPAAENAIFTRRANCRQGS
ncbi:hypothetical protein M378DRAFT_568322 [Amanita muscaria Koide BX008]|uniref:Uncharacterized protein n=1 Tax=Amanita muscaria (strain Koide BX008) TaxID=946122 RepID=A0A0C2TDL1_AMAMK|nr:hypothetical protein M378DRAFT_568322 [Amanita muscaria Koide BX008]